MFKNADAWKLLQGPAAGDMRFLQDLTEVI